MNRAMSAWVKEFAGAVTVCDTEGVILAMNDKSLKTFEKDGGTALLGTNLLECHPEPSRTQVAELLLSRKANAYTIEKNGIKKLIYQHPWYENGVYKGFVELSLEIPEKMEHFVRKG